ncbi:MAG: FliA/WhiG family RNA polymerase sigma factor [Deltaproteobacteria bacterium]|nr:FliA/WhiG family RNA polymerase sigma factor [Deltaproteobacteria bacterium]
MKAASTKRREPRRVDRETRDQLIAQYAPLVRFLAQRLAHRIPSGLDVDDLINAGVIGLIDAIEKFDPGREVEFKTYAEFRVRGAMLDEMRSLDPVSRTVRQKAGRVEEVCEELQKQLGRPATDDEIAQALGVELEEFHGMLQQFSSMTLLSLDELRRVSDTERKSLLDFITGPEEDDPFETLQVEEVRQILVQAIDELPAQERQVLSLYYYEQLNMKAVGQVMGLTESRVCQIHAKAILRLRGRLKKRLPL